jgi:hypothetical protein
MNAEDHVRRSHAEDPGVDIPAPETSTRIDIDELRRLAEEEGFKIDLSEMGETTLTVLPPVSRRSEDSCVATPARRHDPALPRQPHCSRGGRLGFLLGGAAVLLDGATPACRGMREMRRVGRGRSGLRSPGTRRR